MEKEIKNDQNNWLRLQGNILDMSEKLNRQMNESHLAQQRKTFHIFFDCIISTVFQNQNIHSLELQNYW